MQTTMNSNANYLEFDSDVLKKYWYFMYLPIPQN